ncbi:MAG: right-handed parallel beta-helix repeat-containing protein [Chitinophagaceae bacterium]
MFLLSNIFNSNYYHAYWLTIGLLSCQQGAIKEDESKARAYYLSVSGNDLDNGSKAKPWKTISHLNDQLLKAGDSVYFEGGQIFTGGIFIDSNEMGTTGKPIVVTSYGNGKAIIDGTNATALTVNRSSFINILNLGFKGSGRKTGNTKDGVIINNSNNIYIDSLSVSGFQKSGLLVYASANVEVNRVYAYDNGFAGIHIIGRNGKTDCHDILIRNCLAENNPGDPTNLTNHSGNGILAGYCKKVTIEYCAASNNGWDMPRTGNGPVGIWTYESDSVVIQHCIAYRNKTSPGASDGGGFDLDGGVTNAVIQYCLSYENQGSGFGLFQYAGASNWYNNVIRYNISENDGAVTTHCAGILIWNSSDVADQLKDCFIYNNTIYNSKAPAIAYATESKNQGFRFYNNIFIGKDDIVTGKETNSIYLGNNWYSLTNGFLIDGSTSFQNWATTYNKEKYNNQLVGMNVNPSFVNPGIAAITAPSQLNTFTNYQLPAGSLLRTQGLDVLQLFTIDNGGKTFNQSTTPSKGIGACF